MESLKDRILKALDKMDERQFRRFKWLLEQPENVAGCTPLTKSALQDAERTDVVDRIVQSFSGKECDIMARVLVKVNRADLAEEFKNISAGKKMFIS